MSQHHPNLKQGHYLQSHFPRSNKALALYLCLSLGLIAVTASETKTKQRYGSLYSAEDVTVIDTDSEISSGEEELTYGWDADPEDVYDWIVDDFGNSYYYDTEGDYHYFDKFGASWFQDVSTNEWYGETKAGNQWYYNDFDYQEYWDSKGNVWIKDQTATEFYYDITGDITITFETGYQEYYEYESAGQYDLYTYDVNGDQAYYGINNDEWFHYADTLTWEYYDSAAKTWFGSDSYNGWITDADGNFIQYDRGNDQFIFTDDQDNQYYYYPEWAWGNKYEEWYLKGDLHDNFVANN